MAGNPADLTQPVQLLGSRRPVELRKPWLQPAEQGMLVFTNTVGVAEP